ncbi:hypothetical protein [Nocardia farcinica]|uniref:hypothetical protein n=1 Tax=Nocardia farcinica TaxID=37329 RepID=UPI00245628FF|nr:hypothetical protein [Nocardia farcinica]
MTAAPTRIPARHADHPTRPDGRPVWQTFALIAVFIITIPIGVGIGALVFTAIWATLPQLIGSAVTALLSIIVGGAILAGLLWKWSR